MKKLFLILAFLTIGNLFGQGYVKPVVSALPVDDATAVVKGSVDPTKFVRIEADGLSTGVVRIITMPDANVDLAKVNSALQNIVEDITPQLGADLDTNNFNILAGSSNDLQILVDSDLLIGDDGTGTTGMSFQIVDATNQLYIGQAGGTSWVLVKDGIAQLTAAAVTQTSDGSFNNTIDFDNNTTTADWTITRHNGGDTMFKVEENGEITAPQTTISNVTNAGAKALMTSEAVDDRLDALGRLDTSSTITTSRDALLTDLDGINISTASSDVTITIDSDMTGTFVTGDLLLYQRQGTGNITIAYNGTYAAQGSDTPTTFEDNQAITMRYEGGNDWSVINAPQNAFATATDTGTDVDMSGLSQDNFGAASSAATFTMVKIAVGGYGEVLINKSGSAPLVTGATQFPNTATFIASTDMILCIKDFNGTRKYWFVEF